MVREVLSPGCIDPQLIEFIWLVHALFEYTRTYGPVVIVPEDGMFWLTVVAAIVKPATAMAATVRIIAVSFEAFASANLFASIFLAYKRGILKLNKRYSEALSRVYVFFTDTFQEKEAEESAHDLPPHLLCQQGLGDNGKLALLPTFIYQVMAQSLP